MVNKVHDLFLNIKYKINSNKMNNYERTVIKHYFHRLYMDLCWIKTLDLY